MKVNYLITCVRITFFVVFLYTSVVLSLTSVTALAALIVSVTLLQPRKPKLEIHIKKATLDNPYRKKLKEDQLPDDIMQETLYKVSRFAVHDPWKNNCLENFSVAKQSSQCIFAKSAQFWGSRNWENKLPLEENIYRNLPALIKFTCLCPYLKLDGYLIEIPGKPYGENIENFSKAVRDVLVCISDNDPIGKHCMNGNVEARGWVFEFNNITFFVTTFAPFYKENNPRYLFGCQNCFILLQPEITFARHSVPFDTPHTNWNDPQTVRDRIRIGFKKAGRPYHIPSTTSYPMVHDIIKPANEGCGIVKWWIKKGQ